MVKRIRSKGKHAQPRGTSKVRLVENRRPHYQRMFLKEWLGIVGMEQRDVAEGAGISESHLSLIANGERQYTQRTLEKIAAFLNIHPSMLLLPPAEKPIALIWREFTDDEREQAARLLAALHSKAQ